MIEINSKRLLIDLDTLRSFGSVGNGVVRTAFSDIDMESRLWLVDQLTDAGLKASIDGVGNVIGKARDCSRSLLIGSHSDTQPTGGWLDGALGVIYGLEIARAYHEAGQFANVGIDVASWMDEEGTCFQQPRKPFILWRIHGRRTPGIPEHPGGTYGGSAATGRPG